MAKFQLQLFRKLTRHIIYGNIKTRYNVFRKYANDVFGECDFTVQKLRKNLNKKVGHIIYAVMRDDVSDVFIKAHRRSGG